MSFTGHEDQSIVLTAAAELTENFRDANPGKILGGYFSKDSLTAILNQSDCVGIRYYNALKENGDHTIVLVGVLANENDIANGLLADFALPSPPYSSVSNDLNS